MRHAFALIALSTSVAACGGSGSSSGNTDGGPSHSGGSTGSGGDANGGRTNAGSGGATSTNSGGMTNAGSGGTTSTNSGGTTTASSGGSSGSATGGSGGTTPTGTAPVVSGCQILPSNNIFNTPISDMPKHQSSVAFMSKIGTRKIHLDLGQSEEMSKPDTYYGIPYNVVHGNAAAWANVAYTSKDTDDMSWEPRGEADCAATTSHTLESPCTAAKAPAPLLPIPTSPLVEGGVFPDVTGQEYGDHHILMLDADTCLLWEAYHSYTGAAGTWDVFGSAEFDLRSNALRPAGWTSADAAGFPMMPLLLRADEASTGTINHALRFTIDSSSIRTDYTWPARHLTSNGTASTDLPPMGQLFRIAASYVVPATFSVQSKAILQALKTYGVYLADGGSNLYIQGEPSAKWADAVFDEVQSVGSDQFEAVDLTPIEQRPGFDANSGAVPPKP